MPMLKTESTDSTAPRPDRSPAGAGHASRLRLHVSILVLAFLLSRAGALLAGMRYATSELQDFWQFLDTGLLQHHLLRSLWHLHAQPPLFNLLAGLVLKCAGAHTPAVMVALHMALALAANLAVFAALVRLRVQMTAALAACLFLSLNPAAIGFEFDPLYTSLVFSLHCFAVLATVIFVQTRSRASLVSLFALLLSLTLLRSSYLWVWLLAVAAVLWMMLPTSRRQIARTGTVFLLLSLIWPAKNLVLFHHFATSTWGPYSMASHWSFHAKDPLERKWIADGTLKTFAYFKDDTAGEFRAWLNRNWRAEKTGYPELDDLSKRNGGALNWNALTLLRMHEVRAHDVSFLLRHDPKSYVTSVISATEIFFQPTTTYLSTPLSQDAADEYRKLAPYDRLVQRLCCSPAPQSAEAAPQHLGWKGHLRRLCWSAVVAYLLLAVCAVLLLRGELWRGANDRRATVALLGVTVGYVFAVCNLVEIGENMRFRFETEALVAVILCVCAQAVADRRRRSA